MPMEERFLSGYGKPGADSGYGRKSDSIIRLSTGRHPIVFAGLRPGESCLRSS